MEAILNFANTSGIYAFMNSAWGWPTVESLHFIGLCLLIGTVGVFDLRMLGVGRGIPMVALHRLVPWGVLGFALNVTTGLMFFVSAPDQYAFNPAFQTKMVFMALAGMNMLLFYGWAQGRVKRAGADERAPARAMTIAIVSLSCWSLVVVCGRLITYFRPPYHWCVWC
ncbi:MAG: hypothetical protein A3H44_03000 [Gammaproteobacteria bacterium RIFCSPLOWO2_02_FULL_57_10]|nr:MAG: hypothetical protein A3H44_03000 [Gammaproteobacteria bacterium RIFCSPLOWO2_02_FULL_57_10]